PDRAGLRATGGRPLRALRDPRDRAGDEAVVPPDHGVRGSAAGGAGLAGLARPGEAHPTGLDRAATGRRGVVRGPGPRPELDGVHNADLHHVRSDLRAGVTV